MRHLLPIITLVSALGLHSGYAATPADHSAIQVAAVSNQSDSIARSRSGEIVSAAGSRKNRRNRAVPSTGYRPEFANAKAEFTAAAAYENAGKYDLATPLYRHLVQGGSKTPVASAVSFDGGMGPRLGAYPA